ncbi:hypothetical protein B0I73DRAFT_37555 [Yarrowia lipolytica]|nr:hypothetical protein BKA91DRAFT_17273 [Yarrowia lipolytica]KAE8172406.1 hypothetical protein BKA90DRAFT_18726 [Yarrowia lipolytica]RDW39085.1 hypothetical protein B0I73DRAFT_37555 [Yarrowia lipolytica]RMI94168.1 hypothetical protein BD777DRAFT_27058 [Yarrowia lipolytica]
MWLIAGGLAVFGPFLVVWLASEISAKTRWCADRMVDSRPPASIPPIPPQIHRAMAHTTASHDITSSPPKSHHRGSQHAESQKT